MKFCQIIFFLLFLFNVLHAQNSKIEPWTNSSKDDEWIKNVEFESQGQGIGKVSNLPEASGIAPSFANPGYIWGHNDSRNEAEISLIDTKNASIKSKLQLKPGMNVDWEDIECIQDQSSGKSDIYLADIGDNAGKRDFVTIYIVSDEKLASDTILRANIRQTLNFSYPAGPRDAEAILVDPFTKDIFIVSKREKFVGLYTIKYPYKTDGIDTAQHIGTLPFNQITAGSISPDGLEILIKSYGRIYYWKRNKEDSVPETLKRNPQLAPYFPIEAQGESICWDLTNSGYFTLSEKRGKHKPDATLYFYARVSE